MGALARHLEGDIVRGVALDLDGASRGVVEVLVEELEGHSQSSPSGHGTANWMREAAEKCRSPEVNIGSQRTSFAALAISEKAGTGMLAVVSRVNTGKKKSTGGRWMLEDGEKLDQSKELLWRELLGRRAGLLNANSNGGIVHALRREFPWEFLIGPSARDVQASSGGSAGHPC